MPGKRNVFNQRTARWVAKKLYPVLGNCETCGARPATSRHHIDGNPENNERENLAFLCRSCHQRGHRTDGDRCLNGHERTPENTYTWRGWRYCLQCRSDRT